MIAGQFLDVSVQARGESDVEQAMRVLRYKSAKYSIERPLHIGAALAGAAPDVLEALTAFGLPLGEAFQLRDDLLGVYGDPEVTGKPAGDDLTEGKRTVLVALALEHADAADAKRLDESLGQRRFRSTRWPSCAGSSTSPARTPRSSGASTYSPTESLRALEGAPVTDAARAVLRELAAAATQRTL